MKLSRDTEVAPTMQPKPSGRIRWAVAALAVTAVAALPASAGASSARSQVIVQMEAGRSADSAEALVRRSGGRVTGELPIINGFAARISDDTFDALSNAAGVLAVTENGTVKPKGVTTRELQTAYPSSVDAPEAWNGGFSATGRGVGVAVIDTGIAGHMKDFERVGPSRESRVIASAVTNPAATSARDGFGHGTHVAGIIAGNGTERDRSDPLENRYIGVAPEADLISVKVSDELGEATVLDVIYGLQFVVDNKAAYNIRVVNLSLESTTPGSYKTDPLNAAVESAWFKGIVVVAAAGNRGTATDAVQYAPGNDPYVISVGALDDQASQADGDDSRATWSSRGITLDGIAKPELHAPGARIVSTLAPNSVFSTLCPVCIVDGQMIRAGGTSMSAPMVSGAAALLLQKFPNLTPDQVKGVLMRSSRLVNNRFPAVDAYAALRAASAGSTAPVNQGLTPNNIVDAVTGDIDYTRSSWSRSSWSSTDGGLLGADFTRSSWSRSSWSSTDSAGVDTSRSSWSRSSWSTSWTK
jgi:serine protease AprX